MSSLGVYRDFIEASAGNEDLGKEDDHFGIHSTRYAREKQARPRSAYCETVKGSCERRVVSCRVVQGSPTMLRRG